MTKTEARNYKSVATALAKAAGRSRAKDLAKDFVKDQTIIARATYVINGRTAYWDGYTKAVVIIGSNSSDLGTAFKSSYEYFHSLR